MRLIITLALALFICSCATNNIPGNDYVTKDGKTVYVHD